MQDLRKLINKYSMLLKQGIGEPDFNFLMRLVQIKRDDLPRVGYAQTPKDEAFRLGQMPFLHFPSTSIASINESHLHNEELLVLVYFFGLLGTNGPLPLSLTNYVYQRCIHKYDSATRRFLDLINHRLLTLFFRAFAHNEQAISFDRLGGDFSKIILSLTGTIHEDFKQLPHHTGQSLAKFLSLKEKSLEGLNRALHSFFNIKIEVKDFIFSSQIIPEDLRLKLSDKNTAILGSGAQLGSHYYSRTKTLKILVGPLTYEESLEFMPGKEKYLQLRCLVILYSQSPVDLEINLLIKNETIQNSKLDGKYALGQSLHLLSKDNPNNRIKIVKIKIPN